MMQMPQSMQVKANLAAILDITHDLRVATAVLEGDGFISPMVYPLLLKIQRSLIGLRHRRGSGGHKYTKTLSAREKRKQLTPWFESFPIQQLLNAFNAKFFNDDSDMVEEMTLFQYAAFLNPEFICTDAPTVDALLSKSYTVIEDKLGIALPEFEAFRKEVRTKSFRIQQPVDLERFWLERKATYPGMFHAACILALAQPSSAAAEREFSELKASLSQRQMNMLDDNMFITQAMRYNDRNRKKGH